MWVKIRMDFTLSAKELERYQRSILEIGEEKQQILKEKKVLQVGAGGLGSPLSLYLVASGIGELLLFENDILDLSNLGRQILYHSEEVGLSKAQLAKKKLQTLNPNVKISVIQERLTEKNAIDYLEGVDYLVDASDNFETKHLINELSLQYKIPCTIAGIQGYDGQIISVDPHESACYRCCFGNLKDKEVSSSSSTSKYPKSPIPVLAPTCGVVGSIQAMEVIKGLLGVGKRILNGILMVDLRNSEFTMVPIKKNPNCAC